MSYTIAKTGLTLVSVVGVSLGLAYASGVTAGAVGAGVFILGWMNGIGDGVMQW